MLLASLGSVRIGKNCDLGLGQHFQDLGHSFSLYGPPSQPITYMHVCARMKRLECRLHLTHVTKWYSYLPINIIDLKRNIGGEENSMHSKVKQRVLNIIIMWALCKRHHLPPGTGVIQLALFLASAKCTSPRRRRPLFLVSSKEGKNRNRLENNCI